MNLTPVRLENYVPLPYLISTAHLTFWLAPNLTRVESSLVVRPSPSWNGDALHLTGENLELLSVHIDGKLSDITPDGDTLVIPSFNSVQTIKITTAIAPQLNTELDGLYWVNGTFCTQNEPEGFRKITYFLDRPDNLTVFTTTLIAPESDYPILLSNGNLSESIRQPDGHLQVTWTDPYPKPSYLYAVVAGKFDVIQDHFVTSSGRSILLEIYSELGYSNRCTYAMGALQRAMAWDEVHYGREYDLDRFMIVAIDSFNMGAMENKGLNIFNSAYILADPRTATDTDYMNIEGVVAHEYFHNWTGNRVTCRDWFQLTLKEGLTVYRDQEFSADTNSRGVKRISDVRIMKESQFTEDAGPMSHPIQPKTYLEINNFYTSTVYNKGAEVIRMMALLAGNTGFREGTDLYFERHDGQAVTTENFIRAIEDAAGIDLTLFRRWYHQAGTPEVTVTPEFSGTQLTHFRFDQKCQVAPDGSQPAPFVIPIKMGLYQPDGQAISFSINSGPLQNETTVILTDSTHRVSIQSQELSPTPSLLRNFSAPVRISYPYSESQFITLLGHDSDPINKCDAAQKLFEGTILRHYNSPESMAISAEMGASIRRVITDTRLDPAVAASCLQIPSINHLLDQVDEFPIESIVSAQKAFTALISDQFLPEIRDRYHALRDDSDYAPTPSQIARRRLKNTLLSLVSESPEGAHMAESQFNTATNMTDLFAGLVAAINSPTNDDLRETCVNQFFDDWKSEPLVINKWLAAQAARSQPGTLGTVVRLMNHPIYNRLVPNQFRALVGTFSNNLPHFHRKDGTGYQYVAQQLIELDPYNPQIAARVALAFQRTARCDLHRRVTIDQILASILIQPGISKNLYEVVSKIKGSYNLTQ